MTHGQQLTETPQALKIEYIGVKDGLPTRMINQIIQDRNGFVWISTNMGVFRYDGYQFTPLRKLAENGRLLPTLPTVIYCQDDGNLLVIAGKNHFFEYDPVKNVVNQHPIHLKSGRKEFSIYNPVVLLEEGGSFLLEMEEEGWRYLTRYNPEKGMQKLDSTVYRIPEVHSICKDKTGNIFWGTAEAGIRRYSPDGRLADSLQIPDKAGINLEKAFAFFAAFDAGNQLIVSVASRSETFIWNWKERRTTTALDIKATPLKWHIGKSGNSWLFNGENLFQTNNNNHYYDLKPLLKGKVDFTVFLSVMEDAQGVVWVGTDNGILRFSNNKKPFAHYLNSPQPKWGKTTRGFFEDKSGTVYFRCENCGNEADKTIYRINEAARRAELVPFSYPADAAENPFGWTKALLKMPDEDTVWTVGSKGLIELDIKGRKARLHPSFVPVPSVNNGTGWVGFGLSRKGEILAGGNLDQLLAFDLKTGKTQQILTNPTADDARFAISTILEAKNGDIWVGTSLGLFQVNRALGKVVRRYDPTTNTAFSAANILTLFEDDDSSIWAGTFGGGLVHILPRTGEAFNFTIEDGLCNNDITAILPYHKDYLWISTFNGLSFFNKKDMNFVNYYEEDGLTHNEFNVTSAFVDSRGRYYFGGMNGVNAFYPSEILTPQTPLLPLLLTGFTFYDEKKDTVFEQTGGLQGMTEVTFNPYTAWFQINYALPEYTNPHLNQFKTWLENFEKDWIYQGNTPFIRYNRLPAGNYILHIKAADSKGYWSDKELAIRINVQQVFYRTWWFILLCCLAVGAGSFALIRYRYQQRLALERMRTRIASDLHDEVGSSLSHLNFLVGSFDIENSPEATTKSIEKSKELMRKTASDIRDVVWAIDARRDKAGDLLDRMEDFAFDLFSTRNIACQFSSEGINREMVLNPFVRQNIFLIFKEAANNVAKHSTATEVRILLSQSGGSLEMSVADNGRAGNPGKASKGLGLENMQMRAKRIGGTVEIGHKETGFLVRLIVP